MAQKQIGRVDSLRTDLLTFLESIEGALRPLMRDFIQQAAPRNASRPIAYRDYYNEETAALVAERDRWVIERFGYHF